MPPGTWLLLPSALTLASPLAPDETPLELLVCGTAAGCGAAGGVSSGARVEVLGVCPLPKLPSVVLAEEDRAAADEEVMLNPAVGAVEVVEVVEVVVVVVVVVVVAVAVVAVVDVAVSVVHGGCFRVLRVAACLVDSLHAQPFKASHDSTAICSSTPPHELSLFVDCHGPHVY